MELKTPVLHVAGLWLLGVRTRLPVGVSVDSDGKALGLRLRLDNQPNLLLILCSHAPALELKPWLPVKNTSSQSMLPWTRELQ